MLVLDSEYTGSHISANKRVNLICGSIYVTLALPLFAGVTLIAEPVILVGLIFSSCHYP